MRQRAEQRGENTVFHYLQIINAKKFFILPQRGTPFRRKTILFGKNDKKRQKKSKQNNCVILGLKKKNNFYFVKKEKYNIVWAYIDGQKTSFEMLPKGFF